MIRNRYKYPTPPHQRHQRERNTNTKSRLPTENGSVVKKLLILIVLGFNDTSTLEGHFVSSPREREKIDRREKRR